MLLIPCPWCGPRAEVEFTYGGDAETPMPPLDGRGNSREWFGFVYQRRNPKGAHCELWHHTFGCSQWLRVTRDTGTNEFLHGNQVLCAGEDT